MNNLILLKGQLVSRRNQSPVVMGFKKTICVKAKTVEVFWRQLQAVRDAFAADNKIGGALVDVHYKRVVPKSSRIAMLLTDGRAGGAAHSIRGVRFERIRRGTDEGGIAHVFTHFVTFDMLDSSIETLKMVEDVVREKCGGEATYERLERVKHGKIDIGRPGKKTLFLKTVIDLDVVREFSATGDVFPDDKTAVVSLYDTGVDTKELLLKFGVRVSDENIIDGNIVQLRGSDIRRLNQLAPYLIAMGSTDLAKIPRFVCSDEGESIDVDDFPHPNGEPVIGVLDTAFDEDAYFSEWVVYENRMPLGMRVDYRDKIHGTSVSSLIVDGPSLNPRLQDGCGRFRVRHFGIASFGPTSSFAILKRIREIVATNSDIKVWNFSLGSDQEVCSNFISPVGAEIDRIQREYGVVFVVAGTNLPVGESGRTDMKVGAPADSLNSIVVNAVDFNEQSASYTRVGPVLSFFHKPDVCFYGGDGNNSRTGICVCPGVGKKYTSGTSFAAPWIARKLAYLIYIMGLPIEVAKGLIIDSAARWNALSDSEMNRVGFGLVPISIDDVLKCDDKELKFVITGTADEYETHTYEIPVPIVNGAHPYYAKATLVYFPDCNRSQGVDYTITEMDVYLGRATVKNGRPCIVPINKNNQDGDDDYGPYEESARKLFRKWDNVKHIAERLNPRAHPKKSSVSQMWGLKILTKDRRQSGLRDKVKFGVIITLRAMDDVNRYDEFVDLCQLHHWIVNPVEPVVRVEAYQQSIGEIGLT